MAVLAVLAAGCGSSHRRPERQPTPAPRILPAPRLAEQRACSHVALATCFTLRVPLDRSGKVKDTLDLDVAVAGDPSDPVLVLLTGGPGQPGLPFLERFRSRLGTVARDLRLVAIDQRGTGQGALRCPALQRAMGYSDLTVPPAPAVRDCATRLADHRRFYTTADTVADLDDLRQALGAGKITLDGTSYGTYVAERYALAHPDRVSRLVLDSVVPEGNVDVTSTVPMAASARVLRAACPGCRPDPAAELAAEVRARHNGTELLDTLTALAIGRPRIRGFISAVHAARRGNPRPLDGLVAVVHRAMRASASQLSQGLHAATLCEDSPAPWGGAAAPLAGRREALDRAVAALSPDDLGPFDRATAAGNGIAVTCLLWPPTRVPKPSAGGNLPAVPVLLLAGTLDLSTPLEWARIERARAPQGRLMVVRGAGHSVQSQERREVKRELARFFG